MKGCDAVYLSSGVSATAEQIIQLNSEQQPGVDRVRVTFSAWIYLNPVGSDAPRVVATTQPYAALDCSKDPDGAGLALVVDQSGVLSLVWRGSEGKSRRCKQIFAGRDLAIVASQWAHVGFILDEDKGELKVRLYVNGALGGSWEGPFRRKLGVDGMILGGSPLPGKGYTAFLNGKISNVAVYAGSFSSALLWTNPQDPPFRALPPKVLRRFLILHYRLVEASSPGNVIVDASPNSLDARVISTLTQNVVEAKPTEVETSWIKKSRLRAAEEDLRLELERAKKELVERTTVLQKKVTDQAHELAQLRAESEQLRAKSELQVNVLTKSSAEDTAEDPKQKPALKGRKSVVANVEDAYTQELLAFEGGVDRDALIRGDYDDDVSDELLEKSDVFGRRNAEIVKEAMEFAYRNYEKRAMGHDELRPKSGGINDKWGGHGVTLIDALDTLWLMGLKDEFFRARNWVRDSLRFDTQRKQVSFFETTIRDLGGLLSAYDLSGDQAFLDKAVDLGDRLLKTFETATGIPMARVHLTTGKISSYGWTKGASILSEIGTVQLEFRSLSHHTKDPKYAQAAMKVHDVINAKNKPEHGLYPIYINPTTGVFSTKQVTFGALGDSFYEYLLKIWVQGGQHEMIYREQYDAAMDGVVEILLQKSSPNGLHFLADWKGGNKFDRKMDHLVCFVPGMLALGAYLKPESPNAERDMRIAKAIMYTCWQMYERQATGIAPEYAKFDKNDFSVPPKAPHYLLRPETVESMFILHYVTKNPIYRVWGYKVMESLNKYCRTTYGYGALKDVRLTNKEPEDSMESFFFAETLKYLYLLQNPEKVIDLKKWVFNTEAHPLRIFNWNEEPWV